jgi:choline dehydrogenase-like flavoprotein
MIRDARTDSVGSVLTAKVAILGAGAAGLNIARHMGARADGILLVESGGLTLEGKTQSLFAGRSTGVRYFDLLATRLRYYGGTTNHWGGYCRAHHPLDYAARPEIGILPWPVEHADLKPHLDEIAKILGISSSFFDQQELIDGVGLDGSTMIEKLPGFSGAVETRSFQFAPYPRLGKTLKPELDALPGLTQVLNLNVVELVLNGAGRIDHVRARTTTGKEVEIRADVYVLACHAIENARILLSSTSRSSAGVGNRHDNVGRHFSEHAVVLNSTLIPSGRFPDIYDYDDVRSRGIDIHLALSEQSMRKHGVLNNYVRFLRTGNAEGGREAMQDLADSFLEPFDAEVAEDMRTVLSDVRGLAGAAMGKIRPEWRWRPYFRLRQRFEQAPNPRSRVVLSSRKNALGQPEADLDWHLNDLDVKTVTVGRDLVACEISALGLGRVQMGEITRATMERGLTGTHHQMGTTRMSEKPEDGVVDFNSRVHDVDNLYIAGSSVFPHPGDGAPTIMLMAMALRLADHLLGRIR